ncbi:MAG: hypothetical protein LBF62_09180 [Tannerellaceae bacterium]|jgi:hypothetical protein|nr:hypothetical protein [Tannerellaceae bacterium]
MKAKEGHKKSGKLFIIANPIYDTVFKRLMENQQIAKFFISTIIEQPIEDLTVLPQEFPYKRNESKSLNKDMDETEKKDKAGKIDTQYYSILRLDFMATIRDADGTPRKILIELQKSWGTEDVMRFRKYLGEQYVRVDIVDEKKTMLPITTIYILGNNLAGINSPCIKVGRTYIDMINNESIDVKSEFIENLTHNCYVIQAGRITDMRYTTNLDKLLSIFEQKHFIIENSDVMKVYPYQTDDENIDLITDILYEIGANPQKRKEIEDEKEFLRVLNLQHGSLIEKLEEKEKRIAELERLLRNK